MRSFIDRVFRALCAALCFLLLAPLAQAADSAGNFAVRGGGAQRCATMLAGLGAESEQARRDAILLYESWLTGYVTFANRSTEGRYDVSPIVAPRDMLVLLVRQCESDPEALVETMASAVVAALAPAALGEASDLVTVTGDDFSREYRRGTLLLMQQRLSDLGYLRARPDGEVGRSTRQAIARFQAAQGLPETGLPDLDTMLRLLLR